MSTKKRIFARCVSTMMACAVLAGSCIPSALAASNSKLAPSKLDNAFMTKALSDGKLQVLMVGNSFSVDSTEYLYQVLDEAGYDVVIGNVQKGGSTLEEHWTKKTSKIFTYRKNSSGTWKTSSDKKSIQQAIKDEKWDIVYFQQYSVDAGNPLSFYPGGDMSGESYVQLFSKYTRENCSNKSVKVGWNMTWALRADSSNSYYKSAYDGNQMEMYKSIYATTETVVAPYVSGINAVDVIARIGTAVQNLRNSYLKTADINRDEKHLSYDLGRYLAAMTVASSLGADLSDLYTLDTERTTYSTSHLTTLKACVSSAEAAVEKEDQIIYKTFNQNKNNIGSTTAFNQLKEIGAKTVTTSQTKKAPVLDTSDANVEAETTSKQRVISWKRVEGATGYIIQWRKSGDSDYSTRKTVGMGTTSYTHTNVPNNTVYYYRVYARGDSYVKNKLCSCVGASNSTDGTCYSESGGTVCTCYLTSAGMESLTNPSAGKIKLTWNKQSKASGYEIEYSTSGKFSNASKVKISDNSTTSKTISGVTKGKKYYVRVRAYKTTGGHTYYSAWSGKNITVSK